MNCKLIDIHSHVNFNAFKDDGDEVIQRALREEIGTILVGSQIDTSRRGVEYANKYKSGVWAAVGLHPIHLISISVDAQEIGGGVPGFASRVERFDYGAYKKLAGHGKVVAIGECGLDYFHMNAEIKRRVGNISADDLKRKQEETLRMQISLAREMKKPLMLHCRNAYEDMLAILKSEKADEIGGDVHFFAGDWKTAKQFLNLGFYLSFTGVITFTSDYDEVVKKAPINCMMVETDAPYVAPVPYRGKRNEPFYVKEVARRVAELRGIPYEDVARQTTENARTAFNLQ